MAITDGNYVTSPIPNTTMLEKLRDGVVSAYFIAPISGYVLRDAENDEILMDELGMVELGVRFHYTRRGASCGVNYNFTSVQVTDEHGVTHTAYGSRGFFARLASEVDADQIFGGGITTTR